jgi:hypothetical protein
MKTSQTLRRTIMSRLEKACADYFKAIAERNRVIIQYSNAVTKAYTEYIEAKENTNLSTEAKAELQRMIDIGAKHMRAQGCCSISTDDTGFEGCNYRGANGTKCFIGALIADEHYSKGLEGYMIDSKDGEVLEALGSSGHVLNTQLVNVLSEAQYQLHDNLDHSKDFPAAFEAALVSYCSEYGLDYTVPGENV